MDQKQLRYIKKAFLSCTPVTNIDFEKITKNLTWNDQTEIYKELFLDTRLKKFPIKSSYQISFLQNFITALSHHTDEIYDEMYDYFCSLKILTNDDGFTYRHFIYDDNGDHSVVVKEAISIISCGTTGLSTWSAAYKLIDWAAENKDLLKDKDVVELGSGIGTAGLLISKLCQLNSLLLTDCHEKVLELLKENVALNQEAIGVEELFWGDDQDHRRLLEVIKSAPDYIIASDIIYDDSLFESLLKTVKFFFSLNNDCNFIFALTVRNEKTLSSFLTFLTQDETIEHCQINLPKSSLFPEFNKTDSIIQMYNVRYKQKVTE